MKSGLRCVSIARSDIGRWVENAVIIVLRIFAAVYIGDFVTFNCNFSPELDVALDDRFKSLPYDLDPRRQISGGGSRPGLKYVPTAFLSGEVIRPAGDVKNEKWVNLR